MGLLYPTKDRARIGHSDCPTLGDMMHLFGVYNVRPRHLALGDGGEHYISYASLISMSTPTL